MVTADDKTEVMVTRFPRGPEGHWTLNEIDIFIAEMRDAGFSEDTPVWVEGGFGQPRLMRVMAKGK